MISIIVCSINPSLAEAFMENVKETIGVKHEFIIHDNRGAGARGIAAVYNICAERAKYPYLLFAHEDIIFNTESWGEIITNKLSEQTCGVVGFAGATVKSKTKSGWGQHRLYNRCNFIQHFKDEGVITKSNNIDSSITFAPVITLDGLALFVRRDVWQECQFDEDTFRKFHCYDIDFSLQVSMKYCNYVCNSIEVEHLSCGSYNDQWVKDTIILHDKKWVDILPVYVGDISPYKLRRNEKKVSYMYTKMIIKNSPNKELVINAMKSFIKKYWIMNGAIDIIIKYLQRKDSSFIAP